MSQPMHVSLVTIRNILGIEELTFDAGQFNAITGANGKGKTSILEAIKAALKGGHDSTLLRNGATEGEIVLLLEDGQEIHKRVTPDKTDLAIIKDGKKQPRSVETIKALTDALSVNPVDFLRATKNNRAQVLLESMPIKVDAERLTEISGIRIDANTERHALHVIEAVHKEVYDQRTGTNRAVKEKQATINQLEGTLPPGAIEIPPGADNLIAQLEQIDTEQQAELARISTKLGSLKQESDGKVEAIRQEAQAQIDAIKATAQAKIDAERAEFAETERKANGKRERELAQFAERRQQVSNQLATIEQAQSEAGRVQATIKTIETMREELEQLEGDAHKQTDALAGIAAYKADLLKSLPILGVYVQDGEIYRDNVPFDRLNTAQQVQIAVDIARLRAGDLGIICVDGLEALDDATFAAFRTAAIESGLQMFVTRVGNGELDVTCQTEEEED